MNNIEAKAIGFDHYGGLDVLEERNILVEISSLHDVIVKIERAGVNPVDTMFRSGGMSGGRPLDHFWIPGSEVQGEIVAMREPVAGLAIGDKVIGKPGRGGYAEYVALSHQNVFKIPEGMSLDEAAGFSGTASTAYWGLHGGFYNIQPGQTIAVVGASGSVGSYAVQLLKDFDVRIIAAASPKNRDYVLSLGADIFIDYTDQAQVNEYAGQADFVMDASLFNKGEKTALTLAKENATYMGMTTLPDPSLRPDVERVFLSRTAEMTNAIAMPALFNFYRKHGLTIKTGYVLPFTLDGVKEAHQMIEENRQPGKIILSREAE
ncbi:NADP-dependent oxidoreductase [Vagococcus zengguangii]|uniref:NADP-dependent oxidoreductase n=1 Tax=Vagococcus zengguangii TaxID=2571750 RepID=A0A4D7CSC9_9ENTE|nr:NADP-dependent oxidoreductase [Vagococcus zengguangii]QCI86988.1 NADP-dependent oxidoreductase [Vagococcus zengguangii]